MLRLTPTLLFPRFVRTGETNFKSKSGSSDSKTTMVYQLDWDPIDKIREDRWYKYQAQTSDSKFMGTLPPKYDEWVKGMQFAIPQHYMEEIRRCAHQASIEWATERHFDTMIREICLKPAISYAYVAFRLIADCMYDDQSNYFYRGDDKTIATQAMLYKFWSYQTGRGLLKDHAMFSRIEGIVNESHLFSQHTLMSIKCECGERSFFTASSDGWKIDLPAGFTLTCSCGRQPITSNQPGSVTITNIDESIKNEVRNFLTAINEHEKIQENTYITPTAKGPDKPAVNIEENREPTEQEAKEIGERIHKERGTKTIKDVAKESRDRFKPQDNKK